MMAKDTKITDFGAGGKHECLDGLWSVSTITGGTPSSRILRNEYCKEQSAESASKDKLVESLINGGEPMANRSRVRAVANYRI